MTHNRWPEVHSTERVVSFITPVEDLQGGDLIGLRMSAYGDGSNQLLFVAFIDGYGLKEPVCWKLYVGPELQACPIDYSGNFYDPINYRIKVNTFSTVRGYGVKVPEDQARRLFPQLEDLPYDR